MTISAEPTAEQLEEEKLAPFIMAKSPEGDVHLWGSNRVSGRRAHTACGIRWDQETWYLTARSEDKLTCTACWDGMKRFVEGWPLLEPNVRDRYSNFIQG
jgi:hypothetical protein